MRAQHSGLEMCQKSSSTVRLGGGVCTGTYWHRNLQLHRVTLPEPSIRTLYWSNCQTSITTSFLSHLVGCGPVWFWIRTWLLTLRSGSRLVCSVHRSAAFMCLFRSASSLAARVSRHVGWGMYWPGRMGLKSLIGQLNTHWAGDNFVAGSGVWSRNEHWYGSGAGGVGESLVSLLSGRISISGVFGPVGWRDTASAALCRMPGMYTILNLWRKVFSLRLQSLAFAMSSRDRSTSTLSRGLWSTATVRSLQPRTKNLALSRASATARASPSIGL